MQPEQVIDPQKPKKRKIRGIGRVAFLGWFVLWAILATVTKNMGGSGNLLWLVINLVILVPAAASRLENIGRSTWWSLICVLPGLGLIVAILCLILPAGYGQAKKLN